MRIRFGHEITIACAQPTPLVCRLSTHPDHALPGAEPFVAVPERIVTEPAVPLRLGRDLYGNACLRLVAPAGRLTLTAEGGARSSGRAPSPARDLPETPVAGLPDAVLHDLLPSRYCESDLLAELAWERFGTLAPGWGRVQAVCDFVHHHIRFDHAAARADRTAREALREGTGVCRDHAHLAIALCRALNIPAR